MRFGVCVGIDQKEKVKIAAECGFDYIESGFQMFAAAAEEELTLWEETSKEYSIKCEAVNCFLPGSLKVTGENVDYDALRDFVERGMKNCARLGVKIVVFGSSGARNIPEGFSFAEGFRQLGYFLREIASPSAAKYGITVVTEPLCTDETNIINTVNEGVMLSVFAGKDNIKGLADLYHMTKCGDTAENIINLKGSIAHGHISNPEGIGDKKRIYPASVDEYDYKSFVDALEKCGCERCSVEAACFDFAVDAPKAIKLLRSL
ncbi:MAG: sugar phosphate isomerase/epimerase [Clostridia bacterium]|nr:sugar phosphate isomerase/epimerase [Clostridia bacterium]